MSYDKIFDLIYNNNFENLKLALNEEIVQNARNSQGFNLLHAAVSVNRLDVIEYILSNYKFPINDPCFEGRTAFFYACENENPDLAIIKALIKNGADVNIPNKEGISPLHTSCRSANFALTKILLENKACITINQNNGYSVLHYIALSNSVKIFNLLLIFDLNIDLNVKDFDGSTALMLAVDVANYEITKELLHHGADVNIIGRCTSALHLSVVTQQPDIFDLIWSKTDFAIVLELSKSNNLIKLLVKYGWFFPDRITYMFKVLDHKNILQILDERVTIFTIFFYRIRFVKFINEIDVISVVRKFLDIGVKVTQNDLRVFLLNFYKLPNNFDILHLLITKGSANIDDKQIIKFVIELYPKLIPKLLALCIQNGPLQVINYFIEILRINKDMIQLIIFMLYHCTPNYTLKINIKDHLTNFCCALIEFGEGDEELLQMYFFIINSMKIHKVPSLKEISRDVFRRYLANVCQDSNEYLNAISNLTLSKDIINLIQCTFPVNIL